uniref:PRA1 family protein n=1 Tax=Phaeomonas parva TaxID=124430 RepID=A0A7S1TSL6_9STRA|mmetsp:Transcript_16013/g.48921  ORF Transcript_16013/g.48921 Transcript_16013/m.48921 type:complete len:205 (+) Transcript_16013:286-900(+)|eukprot:CAMPEP_0118854932 /NCGR_PEP_ID=MMETSP1163-20130328/2931_1 /TAXON_ID=124430 /ORGANISM="Phaeomonas parva, Strain CCMP2877" /LENGTH=204 /DNA_ID=CAMNT_0006787731 /DNA_START=246 /DNA_END=860 /DNA_ORIENTATION=-
MSLADVLGAERSEQVLEELREGAVQLKAIGIREPAPWGEFLDDLAVPQDFNAAVVKQRITQNFLYFRGNYMACAAVVVLLFVLMSPTTIFVLVLAALGLVALQATRNSPIVVQGTNLDFKTRAILFGVATFLLAVITGALGTLLLSLSVAGTLATAHMVCKSPSAAARANAREEERALMEDVEGGGAAAVSPSSLRVRAVRARA